MFRMRKSGSKDNDKNNKAGIQAERDWLIEHLSEERKTEMEGVVAAKRYLAGAKPSVGPMELKRRCFDDGGGGADDVFSHMDFGTVSFSQCLACHELSKPRCMPHEVQQQVEEARNYTRVQV